MPQIKDYDEITTPAGTDEYVLQQTAAGNTKKITHENFLKVIQAQVDAQAGGTNYLSKSADYNILDSDLTGYQELVIFANPQSGNMTITFPDLADNQEKKIQVIATDLGGKITIEGAGVETIAGYTQLHLQSKNDKLHVVSETGEWQILNYSAKYETGWQNRSDWQDVEMGTASFDYDNLSGTFTVGEIITEATSGNTGIIQSDTGSNLYVKNITGTGTWTNNREITGSTSGATADINEVSGSNKNQDTNVLHGFGISDIAKYQMRFFFNSTASDTDAIIAFHNPQSTSNYGNTFRYKDSNNLQIKIGTGLLYHIEATGVVGSVIAQDWYYKIIVEVKI